MKFSFNIFIKLIAFTIVFILGLGACMQTTTQKQPAPQKPSPRSNGVFKYARDIGTCELEGQLEYDTPNQMYRMSGAGENMWFGKDVFYFAYNKMQGDFMLQFEFSFVGGAKNPHRKVGWMVRNDVSEGSPHLNGTVHDDGLTSIQYRAFKDSTTHEIKSSSVAPSIVQLERKGNLYKLSTAVKGQEFITIAYQDTNNAISDEALVGMFICSHETDYMETAIMKNVRITIPAADDFRPYQDYIGSNLEVLNIESGDRKILNTYPGSIQAPNWTLDGRAFIYNGSDGIIYKYAIESGVETKLNTGHLVRNNNDHVLSFDGKLIGLSDGTDAGDGHSLVYTVPIEGGIPTRITAVGPSYLHGFSPDGKSMIFTGKRGDSDDYDLFAIDIKTKVETQLTDSPGLDDGSEYSPDGKYIYFNSVRSGKMEIWRMLADGSQPEQLTQDENNNWFPHVSPDGTKLVYLAYGAEVAPGDHPFYKQVSIRLMDLETRATKVLVHFYGGQGSFNTPSWSPDSKNIAFISNTGMATKQ